MDHEITMDHETTMDHEITTGPEITMGAEIMMWRESTMAPEIMMDGEIMMRRSQQTAAMRHGMDAPQIGRYRAASVSPTKAPSAEDRTPGTVVRRDTRYRAASVSRILDHVSQKRCFASVLAKRQLRQLGDIRRIRRASFRESESFAADGSQFWGISAIHRTPRRRATKEQTRTLGRVQQQPCRGTRHAWRFLRGKMPESPLHVTVTNPAVKLFD
jgi:hypothetical protein